MKMTNVRRNTAGPLWAVFGAPRVGVPLKVALLALGSGPAAETNVDDDAGISVEQVDMPDLDQPGEGDTRHS
ncbi:MAG: hypothetical protein P8170_23390 [Gemmatimonadota bacterium]